MTTLILLIFVFVACLARRAPVAEVGYGALLFCPLVLFALGQLFPVNEPTAIAVFLVVLAAFLWGSQRLFTTQRERASELATAACAVVSYLFFYRLCLLWPDFISIGERLRDYALLSSALEFPTEAREPWMDGATLVYYLYWYRFGHFLHAFFGSPTWEIYHQLAAFAFSFYFTMIFRLLVTDARMRTVAALVSAVIISLGSNPDGIRAFVSRDGHWWGPSRVINGAINEFPAWSFLLGDIHPHFLNLGLVPWFIALSVRFSHSQGTTLLSWLTLLLVVPSWLFVANFWELPVWALIVPWFALSALLPYLPLGMRALTIALKESFSRPFAAGTAIAASLFLCGLLLWFGSHLLPSGESSRLGKLFSEHSFIQLVSEKAARTPLKEMLAHWGIHLFALTLGIIALEKNRALQIVGAALLFGTLFHPEALPFVGILFTWHALALVMSAVQSRGTNFWGVLSRAFPCAFLTLIIFPEIFFFDDPYGGDIERMNTIFKFYSAAWFFGGIGSILSLRAGWLELPEGVRKVASVAVPPSLAKFALIVVLCGFSVHTIKLRRTQQFTVEPHRRGLSVVDQRFKGAANAIMGLEQLPRGVVIEAQGPAYDYTGHVSTLSSQPSFLAWGNHVGLLTGNYDEVHRRERVTEEIYREPDCQKKRAILAQERIRYLVYGPLESARYGTLSPESVSCLRQIITSGDYRIFERED